MTQNNKPNHEPYYTSENQEHCTLKGSPVLEFGIALGIQLYFLDEELAKYAIDLYSNNEKLKDKTSLIEKLNEKLICLTGTQEEDEEIEKRYRQELFECKRVLEQKLSENIDYLCWPRVGYNE